jgi:hypothetical protein
MRPKQMVWMLASVIPVVLCASGQAAVREPDDARRGR